MSACTGLFDPFNQKLMSVYEAKDDFSQEQMFSPSEKRASRISKAWLFVYGMYWLRCDFRYYRSAMLMHGSAYNAVVATFLSLSRRRTVPERSLSSIPHFSPTRVATRVPPCRREGDPTHILSFITRHILHRHCNISDESACIAVSA
ncbi:hypothetical protein AcV5_000003 [Taiwanofungus camphoratus]|nr:hypothetical protein AcV5_000003 [Antrodia cinnamomea]KAI0945180.1 hypothetical protein AcV7_001789 [Antrodia cinnamomea]KAI0945181.1 hypothetical protein AcV7_001789 [Antrodia cinnamomea]